MKKLVVIDSGNLQFKSIFAFRNNSAVPVTYTYLSMMFAYLKRIGVTLDDRIIVACDYGNWRKDIDKNYKAQRKALRESQEDSDFWQEMFREFNEFIPKIEQALPYEFYKIYKREADDIASCFSGNTYIASPKKDPDERKICHMKKGDEIYSYNLKSKAVEISKIKNVMHRYTYDRFIIYFNNNTKVVVTGEHPFYTTKNKWMKVKNLKKGDEIYYLNSTQKNKYVFQQSMQSHYSYYRIGYLCGAILGDGHFDKQRKRIEFNVNDKDFVMRILNYLKSCFNYRMTFTKENKTYRILIGNRLIYKILFDYCKCFPQNKQFQRGFVAGFFDAEGHCSFVNHCLEISFSNTKRYLLKYIQNILKKYSMRFKITTTHKEREKYLYILKSTKTKNIRFFYDFRPAIKRKYPIISDVCNYLSNGLKIIKIEHLISKRPHKVYNLEVKPNDNYFANNLLVHNCAVRYIDADEKVLVSSDADWQMLCTIPNTKIFSPYTKKYKIVTNPEAVLAQKINGDKSDNLLEKPKTEEEYNKRKMIVNLLELPEWVETPIKEAMFKAVPKKLNISKLPFRTMQERLKKLYNL